LYVWVTVNFLGGGGALGGPAHTGVNNSRFHGAPSSTTPRPSPPLDTTGLRG